MAYSWEYWNMELDAPTNHIFIHAKYEVDIYYLLAEIIKKVSNRGTENGKIV